MRETENNKRYKAAMQGVGMQNVKMQQEAADKGSLQVNVTFIGEFISDFGSSHFDFVYRCSGKYIRTVGD